MSRGAKFSIGAGAAILLLLALLYLRNERPSASLPPSIAAAPTNSGTAAIPSIATLMTDPNALTAASKACTDSDGADVVTLCDRVHSARAQLLAQKYRQGSK